MASQFVRHERHLRASANASRREHDRTAVFPYYIPGPAGTDFCAPLTQLPRSINGINAAYLRDKNRSIGRSGTISFQSFGWHALLHEYDIRPYGTRVLETSIAIIKNNAFRGNSDRLSLAVRVKSLKFVGKYPSVTLEDPSGTIEATILGEVLEDRNIHLEVGAVLMLKDVFAVMYPDRSNTSFHINLNSKVHMSIQSTNIERIFGVKEEACFEKKQLENEYAEGALGSLKLDPKILRNQRNKVLTEVPKPVRTIVAEYGDGDSNRNNNSYNNYNIRGRGRGGAGYYNSSSTSRGRGGTNRGGQNHGRGRGRGRGGGLDYNPYGRGRGDGGGVGQNASPYGRGRGRGQNYSPYGTGRGGGVGGRDGGQYNGQNASWNNRGRGGGGYSSPGNSRGRPPPRRGGVQTAQRSEQLNKRPYVNPTDSARPVQRARPNDAPLGIPATQEKTPAIMLSDAQLDEIFGKFDIDAAISKATQSSAQKKSTAENSQVRAAQTTRISSNESAAIRPAQIPRGNVPPNTQRRAPPVRLPPQTSVTTEVRAPPSNTTLKVRAPPAKTPPRVRAPPAKTPPKVRAPPPPVQSKVKSPPPPRNGRESVSGMDDAALSALLGDLDGTEFD